MTSLLSTPPAVRSSPCPLLPLSRACTKDATICQDRHTVYYIQDNQIQHLDNIHFSFSTKYDIWTIYILVFPQTNTTFSFFRHTDYYIQDNQIRHLDNIHFSFSTKYDIWTIYILVFQQTNTTFPFFDIQTTKQQKTTQRPLTTIYLYTYTYFHPICLRSHRTLTAIRFIFSFITMSNVLGLQS